MQLPQIYRRGVVRPLDDDAAKELSSFGVFNPIRVEWLSVLGDSQFAEIWESGLLQRINEACGVEISDYEEVELIAADLPKALRAVESVVCDSAVANTFARRLRSLLSDASASGRCAYFVF
jgi:hypothetical protein